jgi:EmrB/QacA subfamily drug resistance transporter
VSAVSAAANEPAPATGSAAAAAARPARPAVVLAVCCSALFMVGLDNTVVNVGLPDIGESLHTPVNGLQWTVAGYTIALASLLMFSGAAADRIGRRTVFQVGLSLFVLASWLCSLAPNLDSLIAFRLLQGLGGSMLNPAALGIITGVFTTPASRARAIGVWDGVLGLSMAVGPVVGGALIGMAGWRSVFWVNIPVGLAAIALTALLVPDSRAERTRRPDPVGQFLVIVTLAALILGIIQGPAWGWRSTQVLAAFAVAAVALRELVRHSRQRPEPLVEVRLFRSVPFAAASLTAVCAIATQGGFLFLTTLYLQDVRGLAPLRAGIVILPMPAAMALCSPVCGRILAWRGPRIPLLVAGAALTASAVLLSQVTATTSMLLLAAVYALFGAGVGFVNSPVTNAFMSGVPQSQAGVASGMNSAARQLGASLGVAITGSVLASSLHSGPEAASMMAAVPGGWTAVTVCAFAVALLGLAVVPRSRHPGAGRAVMRVGRRLGRLPGRGRRTGTAMVAAAYPEGPGGPSYPGPEWGPAWAGPAWQRIPGAPPGWADADWAASGYPPDGAWPLAPQGRAVPPAGYGVAPRA